ncbi:organic cation transporter protein-like [Acanthaster planci]|uniref:Organic cation transporter protein-like n=1 Tax=Acanthaster planci TaxID=133434 RepID=A0A8B7YSG3_ACAPL|nr:organic cation transporter protein-like [Acanthaster planci]
MQYDDILRRIGGFGKYQKRLMSVLVLSQLPVACQFIAQVFFAAKTDHWCVVPEEHALNCSGLQLDSLRECQEAQKNQSIPYRLDGDGNRIYSSCERYATTDDKDPGSGWDLNATDVIPCDAGWEFDRSRYQLTIIEDFSLVCARADYPGIAQSFWFVGVLLGSLGWGSVGDWFGRRKTFILSFLLTTVSAISLAFSPNFAAFVILTVTVTASAYGAFLMLFVLTSEIVGPKRRVFVGTMFNLFFGVGYMLLTLIAFLLRDWRHLQLAISLQFVLCFPLLFVLPESPRWLMSKNRFTDAIVVLRKISHINGSSVGDTTFESSERKPVVGQQRQSTTQLDLVRTPNIRKITLIMWYDWFVANMVYYGLSLSTSALGIDDYLAALVSGAVEIPSLILCVYLMERVGRRLTLVAFYISGGLACLVTIFLPLGAWRAGVAMVGKFAIAAAFNHIYVYACELYPTVIRTMGVGSSSMVARVSGILCPIILLLGKHWEPLPLFVFGAGSVIAGVLSSMLPETLGRNLPNTIQEGENFRASSGFPSCCKSAPLRQDGDSAHPPAHYDLLPTKPSSAGPPAGGVSPQPTGNDFPTVSMQT